MGSFDSDVSAMAKNVGATIASESGVADIVVMGRDVVTMTEQEFSDACNGSGNKRPCEEPLPVSNKTRKVADSTRETQDEKFTTAVSFAPLNEYHSLVCGPNNFGPVSCEKSVVDSGCTKVLFGWPADPDKELTALVSSSVDYDVSVGSGVGVGGHSHASVTIRARAPTNHFPVRIAGKASNCTIPELRFAVTEDAQKWLSNHRVPGTPVLGDPSIHARNPDYGLLGQTVLSGMVTIQCFDIGLLMIPPEAIAFAPSLAEMINIAKKMQADAAKDAFYTSHLKDLKEHSHEVVSERRYASRPRCSYRESCMGMAPPTAEINYDRIESNNESSI